MTQSVSSWSLKDTITALVVMLIWGLNFVPMKYGLTFLSPLELGAGRYFFAALPLVFFIPFPTVRWRWIFAIGLFQGVGQFGLLFYSLTIGMTASLASVLFQTQVFFTVLWSFLIFRHRPSKVLWASIIAALIGLLFFLVNALQDSDVKNVTLSGIAIMLAASAMWGLANVTSRQIQSESPNYNPLSLIVWSSFVAVLIYIILIAMVEPNASRWLQLDTWASIPMKILLSVAFLGWASSVIGYSLWTLLLKRHAANKVAPFSLGVPVVGLTVGLLWLKEPINFWQWCGAAFVGVALLLVVFGPRWAANRLKNQEH